MTWCSKRAILGIDGWVAGTGIAFPRGEPILLGIHPARRVGKAREIYRWFTPLLHLDVHTKFVQYIKLAVQECGLGAEWTRAPRLPLAGAERKVCAQDHSNGIANRPKLPNAGAKKSR